MKRQGMIVTIGELYKLIDELTENFNIVKEGIDESRKFQINILNRTPEQSDTWEIEKEPTIMTGCPDEMEELFGNE